MATLYFVQDGPRPGNSGPGWGISLADLLETIPDLAVKGLGPTPPEFNKESPSMYPRSVVVEVSSDEQNVSPFNGPGFYLLEGLDPEDSRLKALPLTPAK